LSDDDTIMFDTEKTGQIDSDEPLTLL